MSAPTTYPLSSYRVHLALFLVLGGLITAAWILRPVPGDSSHLRVGEHTLPHVCTYRRITDRPCPGCGLTRSWVSASNGEWSRSYEYHRLGLPTMILVALQALRHGLWLLLRGLRPALDRAGRWIDRAVVPLMVLIVINGVVILITAPEAAL